MDTNYEETYLAHHGIKGQRWGIRRTPEELGHEPPKPRVQKKKNSIKQFVEDYKKGKKAQKAAETKEDEEEKHRKMVEYFRDHPSAMYRHRDELTQKDVDEIMAKVKFDRQLKDIQTDEFNRGMSKVRSFSSNLQTVTNLYRNAKDIYNSVAEVNNALIDLDVTPNAKRMTKFGDKKESADSGAIKKMIENNDLDGLSKNWTKLTTNQQGEVIKRLNSKKAFDAYLKPDKTDGDKDKGGVDKKDITAQTEEKKVRIDKIIKEGTPKEIMGSWDEMTSSQKKQAEKQLDDWQNIYDLMSKYK